MQQGHSAWQCNMTCSVETWTCSMDTQRGHAARTCRVEMQQGHAAWTCHMDTQHGQAETTCIMDMHYGYAARTRSMDTPHGHAAWTRSMDKQHRHASSTVSMNMQHGHAAWTSSIDTQHGHAAWKWSMDTVRTCSMEIWTCSMDMNMQHRHRYELSTWKCSTDMDMQNRHGQARMVWPWAWICSMDMDVDTDRGTGMDMDGHGHGHGHDQMYILKRNIFLGGYGQFSIHLIQLAKFQQIRSGWERNHPSFKRALLKIPFLLVCETRKLHKISHFYFVSRVLDPRESHGYFCEKRLSLCIPCSQKKIAKRDSLSTLVTTPSPPLWGCHVTP
jgi:hypothetical protein